MPENNGESKNLIGSLANIDSDSSDRWNLAASPDRPRLPQFRTQFLQILIHKTIICRVLNNENIL